jgi:hypothetical protein
LKKNRPFVPRKKTVASRFTLDAPLALDDEDNSAGMIQTAGQSFDTPKAPEGWRSPRCCCPPNTDAHQRAALHFENGKLRAEKFVAAENFSKSAAATCSHNLRFADFVCE